MDLELCTDSWRLTYLLPVRCGLPEESLTRLSRSELVDEVRLTLTSPSSIQWAGSAVEFGIVLPLGSTSAVEFGTALPFGIMSVVESGMVLPLDSGSFGEFIRFVWSLMNESGLLIVVVSSLSPTELESLELSRSIAINLCLKKSVKFREKKNKQMKLRYLSEVIIISYDCGLLHGHPTNKTTRDEYINTKTETQRQVFTGKIATQSCPTYVHICSS